MAGRIGPRRSRDGRRRGGPPPPYEGAPPYDGGPPPYEEAPPYGGGFPPRYDGAPPYEGAPEYEEAPPYGEAPPYDAAPPYGHEPRYDAGPPYGEELPYDAAPPHGHEPRYDAAPSYGEEPPYDAPLHQDGPHDEEAQGPPRRRPPRRAEFPPLAYFVAAGVVVLVAVIVVVAVTVFGGDDGKPGTAPPPSVANVRTEGPGASAYSQAASTAAFNAIADRRKDAKPLTAAEVFTPKKITDDDAKATLKLTASELDAQCLPSVWGTRLAGVLQQARCTQVARATYSDDRFAAMVTIFNLADARGADQVVAQADPRTGGGFPLVPPRSVAFGRAFSTARGVAMGHYAVITWVQRTDGSGDESDAALLSLLVTTGRPNAVLIRATGTGQHS
ncbi:hypothetical protein [Actinoallomurus iriomotensis]|uniref:Uncharacterized protein n=1 Tax=Actinoallomurus iriomotensis TaxID=478107 RepID=A0A9W6VMS3_9ACTN|nr:hypothetical protein [Actinoallomurus iriomotensis]GLY71841.1 hypothetical protein Airi01_001080 [Actinoallomurus iriomotensis]